MLEFPLQMFWIIKKTRKRKAHLEPNLNSTIKSLVWISRFFPLSFNKYYILLCSTKQSWLYAYVFHKTFQILIFRFAVCTLGVMQRLSGRSLVYLIKVFIYFFIHFSDEGTKGFYLYRNLISTFCWKTDVELV